MISTLQKIGLLTALLLAAINASAYKFMSDGLCYNILSEEDRTVEVTYESYFTLKYNSYGYVEGIISIPAKLIYQNKTYSVTSIGDHAFDSCYRLKQVTIPNSVTTIGSSAFGNCSSLMQVTIPNSVTTIGSSAFYNCSSLTQMTIPNSVTAISSSAFYKCSSLTQVTIPNSVTTIGDSAFGDCSSLMQVTIPNSVTSIGDHAFDSCYRLKQVTIPSSVTTIGDYAFSGCSSITLVIIGSSVATIGSNVFLHCDALNEINVADDNLYYTSVDGVLYNKNITTLVAFPASLTHVTIPNSVTSIGFCAFSYCSRLTQVTIPNSVTSISNYAFERCASLTHVTIGNSVAFIGNRAFEYCDALTIIQCFPNTPSEASSYTFDTNTFKNALLYVPIGCKADYEAVDPWRNFWNIQEFDAAGIKEVADGDSDLKIMVRDGDLTIEGGEESAAIEIYSASGQLLSRSFERSVSGLPKGIYLVRVGNQTSKIVL